MKFKFVYIVFNSILRMGRERERKWRKICWCSDSEADEKKKKVCVFVAQWETNQTLFWYSVPWKLGKLILIELAWKEKDVYSYYAIRPIHTCIDIKRPTNNMPSLRLSAVKGYIVYFCLSFSNCDIKLQIIFTLLVGLETETTAGIIF